MENISNVGVFDYERHKLCDLYDSQVNLIGQAYDIQYIQMQDGVNQLTFNLPYMIDDDLNFRWKFLKSEYIIRLYRNGKEEWFVAQKPTKKKSGREVFGSVVCNGTPILLKTKNIYMEFDDENGIGTVPYLMRQILAGTGWTFDEEHSDVIYEDDGVTEKVRSLNVSGGKTGSLGLINNVCNLFHCRPVYDTDKQTVTMYDMKHRDMIFEAEVGKNLDALSVTYNSDDIVTRLYVEGEYGDHGYVGIDDVNPTGLTYILNFDYYRELGLFSATHEAALAQYLEDIGDVVIRIRVNQDQITREDDNANELIGQCDLTVYYVSHGWVTPMYIYGDPSDREKALLVGDEVVVLNSNGTHRYEKIVTTAAALIQSGDYAVAKFGTKAAGSIGAKEVQVEAKEKEIAQLERKIAATTKEDKKAEYRAEIAQLQSEITTIYTEEDGLYDQMSELMRAQGILGRIKALTATQNLLIDEQDEIEATFIAAMGNMIRDGCWQNNNYIGGQEEALYADALERSDIMAHPEATYTFDYIRMVQDFGVPIDDIQMNAIVRTNDDELDVHENLFITKIITGIDRENFGNIEVSNQDFTLSANDLGSLLSRMSQLADMIDQKNQIYQRAEAISKSGTFFADRLNGMIDVTRNKILSTVSNWYTDDNGNLVFESVDGGSAMMLSGAGFMIADSKLEDGSWNWRTSADGHGLNADEITAGFLSADRIESGSISVNKVTPNFGNTLVISGNPVIADASDEFYPTKDYKAGDVVRYAGSIYVFNVDHDAGPWNDAEVTVTSIVTQIEIMPEKIISEVSSKGYSRTFVQMDDPLLDPANEVKIGDYWVVAPEELDKPMIWSEVKDRNWYEVYRLTWGILGGYTKMYCYAGEERGWVTMYDRSEIVTAFTRIEQNELAIIMEAERANAAEGQLHAEIILTADAIRMEVEQNYTTKAFFNMTADGKIQLGASNFSSLGATTSGIYITPSSIDINSAGKLSIKSANGLDIQSGASMTNSGTMNNGGTLNITSGGNMNLNSGGTMTIQSGANMNLNSGGNLTIKSGGNITINSGGNFSLTSTYFSVTTSGVITATSGTVGNWTINSKQIYSSSGTTRVTLDSSTDKYPLPGGSLNTNMYAFWCGNETPNLAPFSITKDGIVTIKQLRVQTGTNTYQNIDFSNFLTSDDLSDYDFSEAMGKLKFQTVKSISINDKTLKIVTTNGSSGGSKTTSFTA